jgi:hypothetical protein
LRPGFGIKSKLPNETADRLALGWIVTLPISTDYLIPFRIVFFGKKIDDLIVG